MVGGHDVHNPQAHGQVIQFPAHGAIHARHEVPGHFAPVLLVDHQAGPVALLDLVYGEGGYHLRCRRQVLALLVIGHRQHDEGIVLPAQPPADMRPLFGQRRAPVFGVVDADGDEDAVHAGALEFLLSEATHNQPGIHLE